MKGKGAEGREQSAKGEGQQLHTWLEARGSELRIWQLALCPLLSAFSALRPTP